MSRGGAWRPVTVSDLSEHEWEIDDIVLGCRTATTADASSADMAWPPLRPATHLNLEWLWMKFCARARDRLAVYRLDTNETVALWCSYVSLVQCNSARYYRLDRLEVGPNYRHGEISDLAFALVACRALELGADGIILESIPELDRFYRRMGGMRDVDPRPGSRLPEGYIAWCFDKARLLALRGAIQNEIQDSE